MEGKDEMPEFVPVQYDKLRSEKTNYTVSEESAMASYNPQSVGDGTRVLELNTLPMPPENIKSYEDVDLPEKTRCESDGWAVLLTPHMNHVHVRKSGFGEGLWGVYRSEESARKAAARAQRAVPYMQVRIQRKGEFALLGREAADARGQDHLTEIYAQIWGSNYAEAEEQNKGLLERIEQIAKTDFEEKLDRHGPYADLPCEFHVFDEDTKSMLHCGVRFRDHDSAHFRHPYVHRIPCLQEVVVGYKNDGSPIVKRCGIDVRDHWEVRWRKHENSMFLQRMFCDFVPGKSASVSQKMYPDYDHTFMNDKMKIGEHIYHQMRMEKTWGPPKNKQAPVRPPYLPENHIIEKSVKDILNGGAKMTPEEYCQQAILYLSFCARKSCETPDSWWEGEFAAFKERLPLAVEFAFEEYEREKSSEVSGNGCLDCSCEGACSEVCSRRNPLCSSYLGTREQGNEDCVCAGLTGLEGGDSPYMERGIERYAKHCSTRQLSSDPLFDEPSGCVSVYETPSASESETEDSLSPGRLLKPRDRAGIPLELKE